MLLQYIRALEMLLVASLSKMASQTLLSINKYSYYSVILIWNKSIQYRVRGAEVNEYMFCRKYSTENQIISTEVASRITP